MISGKAITKSEASSKKKLEGWVKQLQRACNKLAKTSGAKCKISLEYDQDGLGYLRTSETINGTTSEGRIPVHFLDPQSTH